MPHRKSALPPFEIEADERAGIITMVLRGFWTLGTMEKFEAAMAEAIARVAPRNPMFALLSDSTDFKIQAPEVGARFTEMMMAGAARHVGPTAIVVGTTLNKMQAERVFPDPHVRIFSDLGEARRWIDEFRAAARPGP